MLMQNFKNLILKPGLVSEFKYMFYSLGYSWTETIPAPHHCGAYWAVADIEVGLVSQDRIYLASAHSASLMCQYRILTILNLSAHRSQPFRHLILASVVINCQVDI